ncbi:MAG: heat shock protein HspQ [Sphingomonadales bacterium]
MGQTEHIENHIVAKAKFRIGQVVKHRFFPFRGVIYDVDPEFNNSEEWYESIPESIRPAKEQPFYHLFAENDESSYIAYVSQQNLLPDETGKPVNHPDIGAILERLPNNDYRLPNQRAH